MVDLFREMARRLFSKGGIHYISGATTVTGNFYGISLGNTAPDSLKVIPEGTAYYINGAAVTASTELVNFCNTGEFIPLRCSSITITGSGYVKAYID